MDRKSETMALKTLDNRQWRTLIPKRWKTNKVSPRIPLDYWLEGVSCLKNLKHKAQKDQTLSEECNCITEQRFNIVIRIRKKSSKKKWHKMHSVWRAVKHYHVFKKHKNITYNEEENQLLKTNPEVTDKNIKRVTINLFYMFKNLSRKLLFKRPK